MTSHIHDLEEDAPRYVVLALDEVRKAKGTDATVDLHDLASNYVAPKPSNITELKKDHARSMGDTSVDDHEFKQGLIVNAIHDINTNNKTEPIDIIGNDEEFRLDDDVDIYDLTIGLKPILSKPLPDLFTPGTGLWSANSRATDPSDHTALRESMQAVGWLKHLPAIADEKGVVIVGHRRLAVAEELGIEPVITVVRFGDGPAADAAKAALAIASNVGGKPLTPADRKKIAADLYGDGTKFSVTEIGKLLRVSAMTISRDLRGLTGVKPLKAKGGRPRKSDPSPTPPTPPTPTPAPPNPEPQEPAAEPEVIEAEVVESEPVNAEVVKPKPKPINEPKPEPAPEPKPVEEPKSVPPGGLTEDSPGMIDAKAAGAVTEPAPAEDAPAEEVPAQAPGAGTVGELVQVLVDATVALEALTEGWEDPDTPPMRVVPFTAGACAVVDSVRQRLRDVGMALHNMEVSSVIDRAVKPRRRPRGRPPKHKPPFDHKPPLTVAELGGPAIPNVSAV